MKYLKVYKIFERNDDDINPDDVVKRGHKHSWNDIKERLTYLTDIGFQIDEESKETYWIDSEGEECALKLAHKLVTEITLKKKYLDEDDVVSRRVMSGRRDVKWDYYIKWDDSISAMWKEISAVCSHFEDCYHSISQTGQGWELRFIIYTPVEEEVRTTEKEKEIHEDVERSISNQIEDARTNILSQFSSTTYDKLKKNKLGETMWNYQGSFKGGFLIMAVNLSEIKTQKRVVMSKLEDGLENLKRATGRIGKVELREIRMEDLKKLHKIKEVSGIYDLPYFTERYLGMLGYIIEFDYEKLYKKRRAEKEE